MTESYFSVMRRCFKYGAILPLSRLDFNPSSSQCEKPSQAFYEGKEETSSGCSPVVNWSDTHQTTPKRVYEPLHSQEIQSILDFHQSKVCFNICPDSLQANIIHETPFLCSLYYIIFLWSIVFKSLPFSAITITICDIEY